MGSGEVAVNFAVAKPNKGTVTWRTQHLDAARAAYTAFLRDGSNRLLELEHLDKKGRKRGTTLIDLRTVRFITFIEDREARA